MAIYHLSVSTRAKGYGASHAAYIERSGKYATKEDLEATESGNMPAWATDKPLRFWEAADSFERANGAAYTEIELSLPRELSPEQRVALVREFVAETMGDRHAYTWAIHNPVASDGLEQPHAHIMYSERTLDGIERDPQQYFRRWNAKEPEKGGAGKDRSMNAHAFVGVVRERWAELANRALEREGIDARIDHRSYREIGAAKDREAQQLGSQASRIAEIEPQLKRGASVHLEARGVMSDLGGEVREQMARNGERLIAEPGIALAALTAHQSVFTRREVERFVLGHTDGAEQFAAAMRGILASPDLLALRSVGKDGKESTVERYTTNAVLEIETRLLQRVDRLSGQQASVSVPESALEAGRAGRTFNADQAAAYEQLVGTERVATVHGAAGTGKSYVLTGMREAFESSGFTVYGAILQGKTAEDLERDSGIRSRTMHSFLSSLNQGFLTLNEKSVVVVDEAGMVGSSQMERLLSKVEASGARLRLVGDTKQLHAVDFGDAFGQVAQRTVVSGLSKIARQTVDWQRDASEQFSRHEIGAGLAAYEARGQVRGFEDEQTAREALLAQWSADRAADPAGTQIIVAHTNGMRVALNDLVRANRKAAGELADEVSIQTETGVRGFAVGERIMFGRNDYDSLKVKNGTLGTVTFVSGTQLAVALDSGRSVSVDTSKYGHLDYGYALTVHKAQGMTVDRAYVMATPTMSAETAYVAMTRHREAVTLFYGRDVFAERGGLAGALSRPERKEFSANYERVELAERAEGAEPKRRSRLEGGLRRSVPDEAALPEVLAASAALHDRGRRKDVGLQRSLSLLDKAPPEALPAVDDALKRAARWRQVRDQIAQMSPESQMRTYGLLTERFANERADRIRALADKTGNRFARRKDLLASAVDGKPAAPRGMLAAFKRGEYEQRRGQWQERVDGAQKLLDQAGRLQHRLGQIKHWPALKAHAEQRIEKLDPAFARRVAGFTREAAQRAAEQERVKEKEREQQRALDRGKDRGLER